MRHNSPVVDGCSRERRKPQRVCKIENFASKKHKPFSNKERNKFPDNRNI